MCLHCDGAVLWMEREGEEGSVCVRGGERESEREGEREGEEEREDT